MSATLGTVVAEHYYDEAQDEYVIVLEDRTEELGDTGLLSKDGVPILKQHVVSSNRRSIKFAGSDQQWFDTKGERRPLEDIAADQLILIRESHRDIRRAEELQAEAEERARVEMPGIGQAL